jgi:xanthine dehydrogenase accessory factor
MNDIKLIAEALQRTPAEAMVLATVVAVEGSTYRRPGARLLISEERWLAGGVSGGCVERDLLKRAFFRTGQAPALIEYDSRSDDEGWATALGCNGLVKVFLERVRPGAAVHPIETPARWMRAGTAGVLATIVRAPTAPPLGGRLALDADGGVTSTVEDAGLRQRLEGDARAALAARRSALRDYPVPGGTTAAFIEYVAPPLQLVVFGDGYDVPPLCALAATLGWDTTLVASRQTIAGTGSTPRCERFVVCHPGEVAERVQIRPGAATVIMTHNFEHDLAVLGALLRSSAAYIGVLGPRRRTEQLLERIEASRGPLTADSRSRLFSPVGLDIGADGPEEIALAIAAEITAVASGRGGGLMRDAPGPIHTRDGE